MAHNDKEGWTHLTNGMTITVTPRAQLMGGRISAAIDISGPKGGAIVKPTAISNSNMAELIAALVLASDDATLRLAAKMVQRVQPHPRPFLTRQEVWAIVNGYDVDNPQESFGDPSAADQCAAVMHAMQPEPDQPVSRQQARENVINWRLDAMQPGEEWHSYDGVVNIVNRGDAWTVWEDGERSDNYDRSELVILIEDAGMVSDEDINDYLKKVNPK